MTFHAAASLGKSKKSGLSRNKKLNKIPTFFGGVPPNFGRSVHVGSDAEKTLIVKEPKSQSRNTTSGTPGIESAENICEHHREGFSRFQTCPNLERPVQREAAGGGLRELREHLDCLIVETRL